MSEKNQDSMETVGVLSNKNCVGSVCTIDARFSLSSVPSPLRMYASPLIYRFCFNSLFRHLTLRNTLRLNSKN